MGKTKTAVIGEETVEKKGKKHKDIKAAKVRAPGQKGGERVKLVSADAGELQPGTVPEAGAKKKAKGPRGKKYLENKKKVDTSKLYSITEAAKLIRELSVSSFDGSVELHLVTTKTGISAQVELPYSIGKQKKVEVADEETVKKLEAGKIDFDVLLATPEMMPKLVPFARLLGPKGLMPNPKNGTIIKDAKSASKFNTAKVTIKTEAKQPVVHTVVGKVSMKESELADNIDAVLSAVNKRLITKAYLSPTMGPSVKLNLG